MFPIHSCVENVISTISWKFLVWAVLIPAKTASPLSIENHSPDFVGEVLGSSQWQLQ